MKDRGRYLEGLPDAGEHRGSRFGEVANCSTSGFDQIGDRDASAGTFDLGVPVRTEVGTPAVIFTAIAIALVSGAVGTFALLRLPYAVDPNGRAALEATIALSAVATTWFLIANFRRARELPDLLLLCGLLALSLSDFVYSGLPVLEEARGPESSAALRLACELIAALAFAATAYAALRSTAESRRRLVPLALAGTAGALLLMALLTLLIGVGGHASGLDAGTGSGDPAALSVHAMSAAILIAAGAAFLTGSRRAEGRSAVLGAASLLLAGANLRYLAAPAVGVGWVTPREGLRLSAYVLLLGGAYLQHARLQRDAVYAAICSERERIARDLHDGLAQDLACVAAQGQRLDCQLGPQHPLMVATRHALATSRGVIVDLAASTAPTTEAALRLIADELAHRFDVDVNVRIETDAPLSPDDELEPSQRENVVRIAREAIVNAALHGTARHVDVVLLRRGGTLLMRVSDDGRGMSDAGRSGLGLRTMHARAASLGGQLSAHPRAGGGTDLELFVS